MHNVFSPARAQTIAALATLVAFAPPAHSEVLKHNASAERHEISEAASSEARIYGGEEVTTCNWSATAASDGSCTGTLVHPRVILTAAHCKHQAGATWNFGENNDGEFSVQAEKCFNNPAYANGEKTEDDWAYCILPEDPRLEALPTIAPLVGCEKEKFLKAPAEVTAVGFGSYNYGGEGFGIKREVVTQINEINGDVLDVGDAMRGVCSGDSGGPIFMHLVDEDGSDWGWRVVGSTSGSSGKGFACETSAVFVDIAKHVRHLEENEGIDVTPCTNAQGEWDPGPACTGLATDPGKAGGSWPGCNFGPKTTIPMDSCGTGNPGPDGPGDVGNGGMGNGGTSNGGMGNGGASNDGMGNGGTNNGGMGNSGMGAAGASNGGSAVDDADNMNPSNPPTGETNNGGTANGGPDTMVPPTPTANPSGTLDPAANGDDFTPTSDSNSSGCSLTNAKEKQHMPWWLLGFAAAAVLRRPRRH